MVQTDRSQCVSAAAKSFVDGLEGVELSQAMRESGRKVEFFAVGGEEYEISQNVRKPKDMQFATQLVDTVNLPDLPAPLIGLQPVLQIPFSGMKVSSSQARKSSTPATACSLLRLECFVSAALKDEGAEGKRGLLVEPYEKYLIFPRAEGLTQEQLEDAGRAALDFPDIHKRILKELGLNKELTQEPAKLKDSEISQRHFRMLVATRHALGLEQAIIGTVRVQFVGNVGVADSMVRFSHTFKGEPQVLQIGCPDVPPRPLNMFEVHTTKVVIDWIRGVPSIDARVKRCVGLGLLAAPGHEVSLVLSVHKKAMIDEGILQAQQRTLLARDVVHVANTAARLSIAQAASAKRRRIVSGNFSLDQASMVFVAPIPVEAVGAIADLVALNTGMAPWATPCLNLGNITGDIGLCKEFLVVWICIMALKCTASRSTDAMVDALFPSRRVSRNEDRERWCIEYWFLICLVVKVHHFVLTDILEPGEEGRCCLEFTLPEEGLVGLGMEQGDLLMASAQAIARTEDGIFTSALTSTGRPVLDGITSDQLRGMACTYCVAQSIEGGGEWDVARGHFRSFMCEPAPSAGGIARAPREGLAAALAVLLRPAAD